MKSKRLYNNYILIYKMIIFNLRIIFANKFIWFLAGSILFYLGLSVIYVFSNDVSKMEDLYGIFLFSGVLLVFYPSVFGVQNDQDARTIEILQVQSLARKNCTDIHNYFSDHVCFHHAFFLFYC